MIYQTLNNTISAMTGDAVQLTIDVQGGSATFDKIALFEVGETLGDEAESYQIEMLSSMVAQLTEKNEQLQGKLDEHTDLARIVIAQAEKIRKLEQRG